MTIFYYIMVAMLSAVMLTAAVVIVFKEGEKELICRYGQEGENE